MIPSNTPDLSFFTQTRSRQLSVPFKLSLIAKSSSLSRKYIEVWISENKLELNPDKTEFIVFGAKDRYKWLSDSFPVNTLSNCLSPTDVVHNLCVLFDAKFSFTNNVNSVIKSCYISLRDLHCIRRFLSVDTSVVIANALVSSRLDYCNSLFQSLSSRYATRFLYCSKYSCTVCYWCFKVHSHHIHPEDSSLPTHQTTYHLQNLSFRL